ncbi:MAG TPA: 30S ribosomal protein S21 [Oligoflexia bacterium]|nr:30S ribosomal protein S21 [Oligoflexia bacterium]HMP27168.1 30S ribosomal protein S21 [Oligoflexia bacterium]
MEHNNIGLNNSGLKNNDDSELAKTKSPKKRASSESLRDENNQQDRSLDNLQSQQSESQPYQSGETTYQNLGSSSSKGNGWNRQNTTNHLQRDVVGLNSQTAYEERAKNGPMEVYVEHNVEKAMKLLKRKLIKEGLFKELKARRYFEKPCKRRQRKLKDSIKKVKKEARLRRNGLL